MARCNLLLWLAVSASIPCLVPVAFAGGEEPKAEKPKVEEKVPEDTALPKEAEQPELSMGEEPAPDYQEVKPSAPPQAKRAPQKDWDPDGNVDYSRLLDLVEPTEASRGILPPALGFRGYRPSMVALGLGDRTPGYGLILEYSWNRVAAGLFASYLNTKGEDLAVQSYGFGGLYGLYRWLPFDISPYFLLGLEVGSQTPDPFGGLLGLGIEAHLYQGATLLFGWTHHSTVRRGYLGGALGWSF